MKDDKLTLAKRWDIWSKQKLDYLDMKATKAYLYNKTWTFIWYELIGLILCTINVFVAFGIWIYHRIIYYVACFVIFTAGGILTLLGENITKENEEDDI